MSIYNFWNICVVIYVVMYILEFLTWHKQFSNILIILDKIKSCLIAGALKFVPFWESKRKHCDKPTQSVSWVSTWFLVAVYDCLVCLL